MSESMDRLIEYIVRRRNELGLTQRQVADAAGLNAGTLANIEVGRVIKAPSMSTLEKLAKGLRVDASVLIDLTRGADVPRLLNPPAPSGVASVIAQFEDILQRYERASSEAEMLAIRHEAASLSESIGYVPRFNSPIDRILKSR